MSRIARVSVEGMPYHVTQRGNGRQRVFFSESDYRLYLDLLRANAERFRLRIWAYCLMPNHVHFVVVPEGAVAMAKTLGRTHADYARYFNLRQRSCGHVWQARYFSCPLDRVHVWLAMAYVERNPVRAGFVEEAGSYSWSSAAAHTSGEDPAHILNLGAWRKQYTGERWREVLRTSVSEEALTERLREATVRRRPFGSEEFVEALEQKAGRRLGPLPVGRPKKREDGCGDGEKELQLRLGIGI
jgi:putative transposase